MIVKLGLSLVVMVLTLVGALISLQGVLWSDPANRAPRRGRVLGVVAASLHLIGLIGGGWLVWTGHWGWGLSLPALAVVGVFVAIAAIR